jgi:hypothetical protein
MAKPLLGERGRSGSMRSELAVEGAEKWPCREKSAGRVRRGRLEEYRLTHDVFGAGLQVPRRHGRRGSVRLSHTRRLGGAGVDGVEVEDVGVGKEGQVVELAGGGDGGSGSVEARNELGHAGWACPGLHAAAVVWSGRTVAGWEGGNATSRRRSRGEWEGVW